MLRFVVVEKVVSIVEEGIGVTASDDEVGTVGDTSMSWIVSGERAWTSIVLFPIWGCGRDLPV